MTRAIAGHSYNEIVAAVGCFGREIAVVKKTISAYGITAGRAESMSPAEVAGMFPSGHKRVSEDYERPDFDRVLTAMKANRHFTIQQAWSKCLAVEGGSGEKYGYSQYCALFAEHARVKDVVATLHHVGRQRPEGPPAAGRWIAAASKHVPSRSALSWAAPICLVTNGGYGDATTKFQA